MKENAQKTELELIANLSERLAEAVRYGEITKAELEEFLKVYKDYVFKTFGYRQPPQINFYFTNKKDIHVLVDITGEDVFNVRINKKLTNLVDPMEFTQLLIYLNCAFRFIYETHIEDENANNKHHVLIITNTEVKQEKAKANDAKLKHYVEHHHEEGDNIGNSVLKEEDRFYEDFEDFMGFLKCNKNVNINLVQFFEEVFVYINRVSFANYVVITKKQKYIPELIIKEVRKLNRGWHKGDKPTDEDTSTGIGWVVPASYT